MVKYGTTEADVRQISWQQGRHHTWGQTFHTFTFVRRIITSIGSCFFMSDSRCESQRLYEGSIYVKQGFSDVYGVASIIWGTVL